MQRSIIVGNLIGFGALVFSVLIDSHFNPHAILAFFNFSAMLIIFGGITGAIIISFPVEMLREIPIALRKAFLKYEDANLVEMARDLIQMANQSRKEGILSLEASANEIKDHWLRMGITLVVDGVNRDLLKSIMESKLEEYSERTRVGSKIFAQLGGFAPTLGIIGTVMGLVHMLANMSDASKLGSAIAVAFLATFWGILSANLIFLPIGNRVKAKDDELIRTRMAMIEGVLSLQAGESVRLIEERLKVFMNHEEEKRFTESLVEGAGK